MTEYPYFAVKKGVDGMKLELLPYESVDDGLDRTAERFNIAPYRLSHVTEDDGTIRVIDIAKAIQGMSFDDLKDSFKKSVFLFKYSRTRRDLAIMIWLAVNLSELEENVKKAHLLSHAILFRSVEEFKRDMEKETMRVDDDLKLIRTRNSTTFKLLRDLPSPSPELPPFVVEEVQREFLIDMGGKSLLEIFNAIKTSRQVPVVGLRIRDKSFYKVNLDVPPNDAIRKVEIDPNSLTVFMNLVGRYRKVTIYDTGEVHGIIPSRVTPNMIVSIIADAMDVEHIDVLFSRQTKIWGKFLFDMSVDVPVMFDLIFNDAIVSYFMFLDETKQTALEKGRIYMYFSQGHQLDQSTAFVQGRSVTLLLTMMNDGRMDMRISRAESEQQAKAIMIILDQIFKYVAVNSEKIRTEYKAFTKGLPPPPEKDVKDVSRTKEGKRARELRLERPDLFDANFSSTCQKTLQPKLIVGKDVADEYLKTELDGDEFKMINYPLGSGDYYVCEPREPDDRERGYIYPGLTARGRKFDVEGAKLYPCCFKMEQYRKEASAWRYYLEGAKPSDALPSGREAKYILNPTAVVGPGRRGELPLNMQDIFPKNTYRVGLPLSPASFIIAVSTAMHPSNVEERQSMYDELLETLKVDTESEEFYVNPLEVVRKVEGVISKHILLFYQAGRGEVAFPFSNIAYIPQSPVFRETIVVVLAEQRGKAFDYQCELIEHDGKYLISTELLTNVFSTISDMNRVYRLSRGGTEKIKSIVSRSNIQGQVVDSFGKVRGIIVDGVPVTVLPNAQLFVKRVKKLPMYDGSDVTPGMEPVAHMLAPTGEPVGIVVKGKFGEGIVPLGDAESPYMDLPTVGMAEPLSSYLIQIRTAETSKLSELRKQRRVAEVLEELAVYSSMRLNKLDISIDASKTYDLDAFDYRYSTMSDFWEGDKIVVTSKQVAIKLRGYVEAYIRTHGDNIPTVVEGGLLSCAFSRPSDFKLYKSEAIFTSHDSMVEGWKKKEIKSLDVLSYIPKVSSKEPTLFKHPVWTNDAMCLVQDVASGSVDDASRVALEWSKNRINIGYTPDKSLFPLTDDVIVVDFSRVSKFDSSKPMIVKLDGKHAALLPLS